MNLLKEYAEQILERQGTRWCPGEACIEYLMEPVAYLDVIVKRASRDAVFKKAIVREFVESLVSQLLQSSPNKTAQFACILLGLAQVRENAKKRRQEQD